MLRRIVIVLAILAAVAAAMVYWFLSGAGVQRALEEQASAWLGQPVRIASATAQLFPRVGIQLRDVRVGDPARLTLADVEVSAGLLPLLSRRVEEAELIISDSRIEMPLPFAIPATSREQAPPAQRMGGGITVVSIRRIALRDIVIVSRGREVVVSAESSLAGDQLQLSSFTARAGKTSVDASGVVQLAPHVDAQLEMAANQLDLDDLVALAHAFAPDAPTAPRSRTAADGDRVSGRISAKLSAARATAAGVEMSRLAANLVAQGNRVALTPIAFELFGGRYEGALEVDAGRTLAVSLTSRVEGLDVARLAAFGGVEGGISGTLSGNGRFTGRGADMSAVLRAASGKGTATIANGTIRGLNLVRAVILFFGRPDADAPPSSGERFTRIAAPFSLARQVLSSEALTLESPDVDVLASGTLAIATKALDARATLILSESLSAQAGTDLGRFTREENRIVLPAAIGGTLGRPRVTIDAAAAVERGLRNEMQRRLKGLLDRIKPPSR